MKHPISRAAFAAAIIALVATPLSVAAQQPPEHRLSSNGLGREVGIAQNQRVAMAHGAQRMEHVRIQQRVEILQQGLPPLISGSAYLGYSPYGIQIFFTCTAWRNRIGPSAAAGSFQSVSRP